MAYRATADEFKNRSKKLPNTTEEDQHTNEDVRDCNTSGMKVEYSN